jgi:hypothetical protein
MVIFINYRGTKNGYRNGTIFLNTWTANKTITKTGIGKRCMINKNIYERQKRLLISQNDRRIRLVRGEVKKSGVLFKSVPFSPRV